MGLCPVPLLIHSLFLEYYPFHYPIFIKEISTHFSRFSLLLSLLEVLTQYTLSALFTLSVLYLNCHCDSAFVCHFLFAYITLSLQCKFRHGRKHLFHLCIPQNLA